ncbi:TetR/AcrR family transcriptional regulator [Streptomyces sp. GC420]|uniref:TetR/AcrR family transcriptional regulator n=1 Tax=Streptomyces sp. GC420 TaxID=2697568 RepID=UPI0014152521|nr:TetR/AcrR family transcriptional regulator [Streptomyces sp. GC420]NBM17948.1 TetR family transcriptional regulator [Streptomyces sp. GC420]
MEQVKPRREQYAESTRRALLDTGLGLFTERGYANVSAEELVRAAGLSRGALYHHFERGKQGLFVAVFEELEVRASRRVRDAMAGESDPWRRALAGVEAFLAICTDPDYREIVLLQGPIALGWQRWRELDQRHLHGQLRAGLAALRDLGLVQDHPTDLMAAAVYGALTEISVAIATADDPARARERAGLLVRSLLEGLRTAG